MRADKKPTSCRGDAAEEDMTGVPLPSRLTALLLCWLTGITCGGEAVLVYSRTGGNLLLPCADLLLSDCSLISWTFFTSGGSWNSVEIGKSQVGAESHESNRISITSNCSLRLQGLKEENAGSYNCHRNGSTVVAYYLSVLTISSASSVTSLQPGGNLSLSCLLFTYFDAGNCRASSMFNLSWVSEDGATLATDNRTRLVGNTRCSVTLVTNLEMDDNNRKWRCQVNTKEEAGVVFLDFTSTFVFGTSLLGKDLIPSDLQKRPFQVPIPRLLLCVLMTMVVVTAGVFVWRKDKDGVRSSADIQLHI